MVTATKMMRGMFVPGYKVNPQRPLKSEKPIDLHQQILHIKLRLISENWIAPISTILMERKNRSVQLVLQQRKEIACQVAREIYPL